MYALLTLSKFRNLLYYLLCETHYFNLLFLAEVIERFRKKIEAFEADIKDILKQEEEDKEVVGLFLEEITFELEQFIKKKF